MIQQFHSWVYIWTKLYFKKTHAPLFTIAKTWKQPKYLSTDEWIRKILYIYIYIYIHIYTVTSVMSDCLDPMEHGPPGSSVHGILQARILEWVALPSSWSCFRPRD